MNKLAWPLRALTVCISILTIYGFSQDPLASQVAEQGSDEEAFLVRRIAEFWKDGDLGIVKQQIIDFLDRYPQSEHASYFWGKLGHIYLQEKEYTRALECYEHIQDEQVKKEHIVDQVYCYYELDEYGKLCSLADPYLQSTHPSIQERKDELYFFVGEGLFRRMLAEDNEDLKRNLATQAQAYYVQIKDSHLQDVAAFPLAQIDGILGHYEEGSKAYLALADKHPDMKEDLLFQAATFQAQVDPQTAIATFNQIKEMGGEQSKNATFNYIVLLFQTQQYDSVIADYEKIVDAIPETQQAMFYFIVGQSLFSTKQYAQAINPISIYISAQSTPSDELKNALLIQMTCAHHACDDALFKNCFEKLDMLFPGDPELPKALFMHALLLKEKGDFVLAAEKLQEIKEKYPAFEQREDFLFEYALLAYQNEHWHESYRAFHDFISEFPDSDRIDHARRLFLSASLSWYQDEARKENKDSLYSRAEFFRDLQIGLDHYHILNEEEKIDWALLYAQTAYEIAAYDRALKCLQDHIFVQPIKEKGHLSQLARAHLIAGLCYGQRGDDGGAICMHLEKAIELDPDAYDTASTHIELYNTYIALAGYPDSKQLDQGDKQDYLEQAASHLQIAIADKGASIKRENLFWLANYYFVQAHDYCKSHWTHQIHDYPEIALAVERATEHYEYLLYEGGQQIQITSDSIYLEDEILKFAKLLEYQGEYARKQQTIESLIEQQYQQDSLPWQSKSLAFFELASTYKKRGLDQKAYETFAFVQTLMSPASSLLGSETALEAARLHFKVLDDSLKNESNEEVLGILNLLKELQIRKNPNSEPVHLEAALEYASIRSNLVKDQEESGQRYLFFLNRMEEDFNAQDDPVAQNYLTEIHKDRTKEELFQCYMQFIKAERIRLAAEEEHRKEKFNVMEELHENALSIYEEIRVHPAVSFDLHERILASIERIHALTTYKQ